MDHKKLLLESGALVAGHFRLNSDLHAEFFVNKTTGLVTTWHAQEFGRAIAYHFRMRGIEVIVGPELGAITLMTRVADVLQALYPGLHTLGVIATKIPDTKPTQFEIARDQARFVEGRKVLLVEDVLTKGLNAAATAKAIRAVGGDIRGAGVLWNRGGVTAEQIGVPELFSLIDEPIPDYEPDDCPSCKRGIPIDPHLGKGPL